VRNNLRNEVILAAREHAEERILDSLVGSSSAAETREKFRSMLRNHELDEREIEISIQDNSPHNIPTFDVPGGQMGVLNIGDMISKAMGGNAGRTKTKKMTVEEAYTILTTEESDKLIDDDTITKHALNLVENEGIVFLDEIDKIASRSDLRKGGGEVSREGVQRDLLPLIEGTTVTTKYGQIKTDYILFIASGAFYSAKPSDLLPELQGRLPIRVELEALTKEDMISILTEPEGSLIKQYIALMATENVKVNFTADGIEQIAQLATDINREVENIGARRLHTIMEKLLEEISFTSANVKKSITYNIDKVYVEQHIGDLVKNTDLSKFIL
jgi:ATP-dependent HslUV protease ATP-binding subunit HslU